MAAGPFHQLQHIFKAIGTANKKKICRRAIVWYYFFLSLQALIPAIFIGRQLNATLTGTAFFTYRYRGLVFIGASLIISTFPH
ncbi:MAG: hypothetical protein ABI813_15460 [Bacteroidota bacterium]